MKSPINLDIANFLNSMIVSVIKVTASKKKSFHFSNIMEDKYIRNSFPNSITIENTKLKFSYNFSFKNYLFRISNYFYYVIFDIRCILKLIYIMFYIL